MPDNIVRAEYDELARIVQQFYEESGCVENLTNQMKSLVDQLEGGGWMGMGARSFYDEMHHDVFPGLERLIHALCDAGSAISQISDIIRQAEEAAARLFLAGAADLLADGVLPLSGTEETLPLWAQLGRWWVSDKAKEYILSALPGSIALFKESDAGRDLIEQAKNAGICFIFPDGTVLGDPHGDMIEVTVSETMPGAHGHYDLGAKEIAISADAKTFQYTTKELTKTVAHEMQHALDDANHQLNYPDLDYTSGNVTALESDLQQWVDVSVNAEVRAHERGYSVRDGDLYLDDGVLEPDEARYILQTRGYEKVYEKKFNDAFAEAYATNPDLGLRTANVEVGPDGLITVDVNVVYLPVSSGDATLN